MDFVRNRKINKNKQEMVSCAAVKMRCTGRVCWMETEKGRQGSETKTRLVFPISPARLPSLFLVYPAAAKSQDQVKTGLVQSSSKLPRRHPGGVPRCTSKLFLLNRDCP